MIDTIKLLTNKLSHFETFHEVQFREKDDTFPIHVLVNRLSVEIKDMKQLIATMNLDQEVIIHHKAF